MRHLKVTTVVVLVLAFRACVIDGKECQSDSECDSNQACQNSQCVDPCQSNPPCVTNSQCQVSNHLLQCLCQPGFTGNPYTECSAVSECKTDEDCDAHSSCAYGSCVNPCIATSVCGDNTVCSVIDHRISCVCKEGHSGNPYEICNKIAKPEIEPKIPETARPNPEYNKYHAEISFKTDWRGALQYCQSQGRRLATVQSWEENSQVLQVIGQTNVKLGHFWTSGTNQYGNGWIWETSNQPFTFTYWHLMQPDNFMWLEHCMGYWEIPTIVPVGYKWNDRHCGHKGFLICEELNNKISNNSAQINYKSL